MKLLCSQLEEYLGKEGETEGYYVVFHARPSVYGKLTFAQMEFAKQHHGATIHVYLVRLGELFEEPKPRKKKVPKDPS